MEDKKFKFQCKFMLLDCSLEEVDEKNVVKLVTSPEEFFLITFKSEDEKKDWQAALEECIEDNSRKYTTLRNVRKEQDNKVRSFSSRWTHVCAHLFSCRFRKSKSP